MAKKKMNKTKLTRSQAYKNDNILEEIQNCLHMCGCDSDFLFAEEYNVKKSAHRLPKSSQTSEKEWDIYIKNVKRIKSLASKLQIKKFNKK